MKKNIDFNKLARKAQNLAKGEWERANRHPLKYLAVAGVKAAFLIKAGIPVKLAMVTLGIGGLPAANQARQKWKRKDSPS